MICKKCNHPLADHSLLQGCCIIKGCNCRETISQPQSVNFERRVKFFRIDEQIIFDLLQGWRSQDWITLPLISGVPKDAKILAVHHDFRDNTFFFKIWHQSWPIIGENGMIPDCTGAILESLRFERKPNGVYDTRNRV